MFHAAANKSACRPLAAALILVSISAYAPSWHNYFVCDDYEFLGRVTLRNAHEYFFRPWAYGHEYRPLVPYPYALDAAISGEDPTGYHVTSTILHTTNSWMLMESAAMIRLAWPIATLASFHISSESGQPRSHAVDLRPPGSVEHVLPASLDSVFCPSRNSFARHAERVMLRILLPRAFDL
jgi:hypothetical protein